jgi:cysteine desulfurase/selenocysteine lyase
LSSSIDVERARADTPGVATVAHLNNAGAALPPRQVLEPVLAHLRLEAEIGGYEAEHAAHERLEGAYGAIARLIACAPDEVAIVENATRAWDMAFYGLPIAAGDRILCSEAEYASNYLAFLQVARRRGARIDVVPSDEHGELDVAALERMIDERVRLIAVTHVPTNGGLVNPAAAIGRVARRAGVPYLLDACQSVGQLPVDVEEIGCDFLSATGRKFLRAPRGTGFLYVRRARVAELEPPFIDLHAARWTARDEYELRPDARRFEGFEANMAAKLGLGAAAEYAAAWGVDAIWARVRELAGALRERLGAIPGVGLRDRGRDPCGIVTFTRAGVDPRALTMELRREGINVWFSETRSTRLDMEARGLAAVVRASVHYYNDLAEIDRFCARLQRSSP